MSEPAATPLRAGAATVDITPQHVRSTFLAGFGMGRKATGVHRPLEANALYLASGDTSVVLVSLDLIGLLKVWCDRIRDAVTEVSGDAVVIACTHTHAGPDTLGYWGPSIAGVFPRSDGKNPAYMHWLVERAAACIDAAVRDARDATMRVASFVANPELTRNDRKGGARYDHCVVAGFDDADDQRIGAILSYASHPEGLWEHNTLISPDYVGPVRDGLCSKGEGTARGERVRRHPVVFLSGPLGAMLTINVDKPPKDIAGRIESIEELGRQLGHAAFSALAEAPASDTADLDHERVGIDLATKNWRYKLLERLGLVDVITRNGVVSSLVHSIRVGPMTIVTAPGEVCPELGARIRDRVGGEHPVLVCLCEDEFGYMLEPEMFDDAEYKYEKSMSLGRDTAATLFGAYESLGFAPSEEPAAAAAVASADADADREGARG